MKTIVVFLLLVAPGSFLNRNAALAQHSAKLPCIGILLPGPASDDSQERHQTPILQGLAALGYINGANIALKYRYAEGQPHRLAKLAIDLVRLQPAVIIALGTEAIFNAMKATRTIPIVMVSGGNPVGRGFVKSASSPDGNVTGLSSALKGEGGKRVELLKEMLPKMKGLAILNADTRKRRALSYETAAQQIGLRSELVHFSNAEDLTSSFAKIASLKPDALVTVRNVLTLRHDQQIVDFALRNRLPAMYESREFVTSGGLISYGVDYTASWRRAAVFVDKILKGAHPATLPVEPPQLELVVNLKTANEIGVTFPPHILLEASEVIK